MSNENNLDKAKSKADAIRSILLVMTTVIALFGSVFAGYIYMDERYALAEDVNKLEERLTLSELRESLRIVLDEYFFLKKQIRKYPDDLDIKDQLKDVEERVNDLRSQIKEMTRS